MTQTTAPLKTAGCICWHELYTRDQDKASQFYCDLMGWTTQDWPMGDNSIYRLVKRGETHFAGIMNVDTPEFEGVPAHWMIYIQVDDVDATAAKASSLGAKVIHGPEDLPEIGRFAVISDPFGATFTIFKSAQSDPAPLPYAFVWNELLTTDQPAAVKFYTELFGWTTEENDMGPAGKYVIFKNDNVGLGGCMQISDEMKGVPPHWMAYIGTGDIDASLAKAQELGASMDIPVTEISPEIGKFCMITDPTGAKVSLYQAAHEGQCSE